jgi:hypothetical protein
LHKALLRYHAEENWPVLREALRRMGKQHLIGVGPECLVPPEAKLHGWKAKAGGASAQKFRTQHVRKVKGATRRGP